MFFIVLYLCLLNSVKFSVSDIKECEVKMRMNSTSRWRISLPQSYFDKKLWSGNCLLFFKCEVEFRSTTFRVKYFKDCKHVWKRRELLFVQKQVFHISRRLTDCWLGRLFHVLVTFESSSIHSRPWYPAQMFLCAFINSARSSKKSTIKFRCSRQSVVSAAPSSSAIKCDATSFSSPCPLS